MSTNSLYIVGSARSESTTLGLLKNRYGLDINIINLAEKDIQPYCYERRIWTDDFEGIVSRVLEADSVILATPVYWYSMSGVLKNFMDRLTDLITFQKVLGRQLAGKNMHLFVCGTDKTAPDGFHIPFEKTAKYFKMHFSGWEYQCISGLLKETSL